MRISPTKSQDLAQNLLPRARFQARHQLLDKHNQSHKVNLMRALVPLLKPLVQPLKEPPAQLLRANPQQRLAPQPEHKLHQADKDRVRDQDRQDRATSILATSQVISRISLLCASFILFFRICEMSLASRDCR